MLRITLFSFFTIIIFAKIYFGYIYVTVIQTEFRKYIVYMKYISCNTHAQRILYFKYVE